jgi:hypothetical protein
LCFEICLCFVAPFLKYLFTLCCFIVHLCFNVPLRMSIFPPFLFLQYVGDLTFNVGVWEEARKHRTLSWWKQ